MYVNENNVTIGKYLLYVHLLRVSSSPFLRSLFPSLSAEHEASSLLAGKEAKDEDGKS